MAANHITVNSALVKGAQLLNLIAQSVNLRSGVAQMYGVLVQMIDGVDYTVIATAMGITPTEAANLYNLVLNANVVLQGADMDYFVERLG